MLANTMHIKGHFFALRALFGNFRRPTSADETRFEKM
jgi:hypothetical protein